MKPAFCTECLLAASLTNPAFATLNTPDRFDTRTVVVSLSSQLPHKEGFGLGGLVHVSLVYTEANPLPV